MTVPGVVPTHRFPRGSMTVQQGSPAHGSPTGLSCNGSRSDDLQVQNSEVWADTVRNVNWSERTVYPPPPLRHAV